MNDNQETTVTLNGKQLTVEQFNEEKTKLQEKKIKVVETETNTYKTRLEG